MKVLVTIGSMSEKKFTRLFNIIDELCSEGVLDGNQIIAQVGFDHYESSYYKCFDMVADEDFKKMIDECDLVVTHAGTGTVTACLKKRKKLLFSHAWWCMTNTMMIIRRNCQNCLQRKGMCFRQPVKKN